MINIINHYKNGKKLYDIIVDEVAKKYHLTVMEFSIILFLHNNPGYDTAAEIVKYRHLAKSHVSTSIKSLIEKDLIEANFNKDDHKSIHLKLKDKANVIAKDGYKAQLKFKELTMEGFSEDEIKTLVKMFHRIDANINKNLD